MAKLPLLLALALLAGCNNGSGSGQPAAKPTTSGYIARVRSLAEGQRRGVLFRAIRGVSGGSECQGVTAMQDIPAGPDGRPSWRVTCEEGSRWFVTLADDGTAQVTGAPAR